MPAGGRSNLMGRDISRLVRFDLRPHPLNVNYQVLRDELHCTGDRQGNKSTACWPLAIGALPLLVANWNDNSEDPMVTNPLMSAEGLLTNDGKVEGPWQMASYTYWFDIMYAILVLSFQPLCVGYIPCEDFYFAIRVLDVRNATISRLVWTARHMINKAVTFSRGLPYPLSYPPLPRRLPYSPLYRDQLFPSLIFSLKLKKLICWGAFDIKTLNSETPFTMAKQVSMCVIEKIINKKQRLIVLSLWRHRYAAKCDWRLSRMIVKQVSVVTLGSRTMYWWP